jgi:hypothetical protein
LFLTPVFYLLVQRRRAATTATTAVDDPLPPASVPSLENSHG